MRVTLDVADLAPFDVRYHESFPYTFDVAVTVPAVAVIHGDFVKPGTSADLRVGSGDEARALIAVLTEVAAWFDAQVPAESLR